MTTHAEILNAALTLSPHERGELAEVLWDSIGDSEARLNQAPGASLVLSEAWKKEIDRRSAEIDAGIATYVTYEQMRERARRAAGHDG